MGRSGARVKGLTFGHAGRKVSVYWVCRFSRLFSFETRCHEVPMYVRMSSFKMCHQRICEAALQGSLNCHSVSIK